MGSSRTSTFTVGSVVALHLHGLEHVALAHAADLQVAVSVHLGTCKVLFPLASTTLSNCMPSMVRLRLNGFTGSFASTTLISSCCLLLLRFLLFRLGQAAAAGRSGNGWCSPPVVGPGSRSPGRASWPSSLRWLGCRTEPTPLRTNSSGASFRSRTDGAVALSFREMLRADRLPPACEAILSQIPGIAPSKTRKSMSSSMFSGMMSKVMVVFTGERNLYHVVWCSRSNHCLSSVGFSLISSLFPKPRTALHWCTRSPG
jgi:hypothetical protein